MAAMIAGLLIFLVAVSLLALKVGFLLLLILAPVFLLIGVHPGSGRIIAMRWVEMLVGTLLRQAVLALVLGVLVYGYALIISMAMPWGMQVMFMALLTIAVFFYRRPFQHLFSSMDGHTLTTRMLGDAASAPTLQRAAGVLPPVAAARAGRWGMRKAEPVLQAAAIAGGASVATAAAAVAQGKVRGEDGGASATGTASGARVPAGAQPAPLDTDAQAGGRRKATGRPVTAARPGAAPPLNLSGAGKAGGTPPTRSGGSPARGGGGWFGGRSGGGWAPQGSSGSGGGSSAAPSSGGRSVRALLRRQILGALLGRQVLRLLPRVAGLPRPLRAAAGRAGASSEAAGLAPLGVRLVARRFRLGIAERRLPGLLEVRREHLRRRLRGGSGGSSRSGTAAPFGGSSGTATGATGPGVRTGPRRLRSGCPSGRSEAGRPTRRPRRSGFALVARTDDERRRQPAGTRLRGAGGDARRGRDLSDHVVGFRR